MVTSHSITGATNQIRLVINLTAALRRAHDAAEWRSMTGLLGHIDSRIDKKVPGIDREV
jgi:hypothetical protein